MPKVVIGEREEGVRLIGIDVPEEGNDDGTPDCGFEEPEQARIDAVPDRRIVLEPDVEDMDEEQRLLRHVWTMSLEGGRCTPQ